MAKSNVYVVTGIARPVAAFTDYDEMQTWVNKRKTLPRTMVIYKMRKGGKGDVAVVPVSEVLYA